MGKLIENYSLQSQLGSGVYSRVFRAINVVTKQEVAIKMVKADKFKELPKLEEGTINEINTLTSLKPCPNIIRYYDMLKTVNNFYFVYEYCNGGTLEKILKKNSLLSQKQSLIYFRQLTNAFKVLAQHNIMHRDIKPQNILLHNGILKVADFGFCKPLEHQDGMAQTMLGSPIYMAPQVLKGQPYTMKADVWSLGVVLYRMLFGFCPFESQNIGKLILMLNENQVKIPTNQSISSTLQELLKKMLNKDQKTRVDWNEVFNYQITENGQMINPNKKEHNSLKASTTGSLNSINFSRQEYHVKKVRKVESPFHNDSKRFQKTTFQPSQLRQTLHSKSPIRGSVMSKNLKKQVHIKNHKKCLQLSQLSIEVAHRNSIEAITISFILNKSIQKQLLLLKQSLRKDNPNLNSSHSRPEDSFIYDLNGILGEQLKFIGRLNEEYEEILVEGKVNTSQVMQKKKEYLKMFIVSMNSLETKEELSLCHQLLDYILEDILIHKKTYEKLNSEQMCKKIRDKLQQIK